MNSIFIRWWKDSPRPARVPKARPKIVPHPDAEALLREHRRLFLWLARKWLPYANPFGDRAFGVEDLAAEIMLAAAKSLHRHKADRGAFSTWLGLEARQAAQKMRLRALRPIRARFTVGQFVEVAGECFDTFAATADPKAREPWELAAEREES